MKIHPEMERYRVKDGPYASEAGDNFGLFQIPAVRPEVPQVPTLTQEIMTILAGNGEKGRLEGVPFDHVSVSFPCRAPSWAEICLVKDMFFAPEECVMQLHPPRSERIDVHPYCLHLWKPLDEKIPMPPAKAI